MGGRVEDTPFLFSQEPVMSEDRKPFCPECADEPQLETPDRRGFIRVVGERTAALFALGGLAGTLPAAPSTEETKPKTAERPAKPAESLVRELYSTLSDDQKKQLVLPLDHGGDAGRLPSRLRIYNAPFGGTIGRAYSRPQQELIERIMRAISSDEEGYRRLSRNGNWDTGGGMQGCGAVIFGEPADDKPFTFLFSGHHLTARCDGNFKDGVAFGGPVFYGHSPNGYSDRNVFNYQTKSVLSVFDALADRQREKAVVKGSPGEGLGSVKIRPVDQDKPGIRFTDLSADQQKLVEKVMRDILSPYRKEDADEVMQIVKSTGGLDKVSLAFYEDRRVNDNQRWHFWRLEGPGFVWNYRVLPHVHCYVNIATALS
jgi:hypothetical protein